jgi:nucleoside 2-deoxyribosyltransferase
MSSDNNFLTTVISGSFRKHLQEISLLKKGLEESGVTVLSPSGNIAINPDEEFIILESDPVELPELLQASIFSRIRKSTFLVVANVNGYLGRAATLEIGYAIATGIKIYSIEEIDDPNIAPFCTLLSNVFPNINLKNHSSEALEEALG